MAAEWKQELRRRARPPRQTPAGVRSLPPRQPRLFWDSSSSSEAAVSARVCVCVRVRALSPRLPKIDPTVIKGAFVCVLKVLITEDRAA